jgi:hypothetical protein
MKQSFLLLVALAAGIAVGSVLISRHLTSRHARRLAEDQAAWQADRALLEQQVEDAKAWARRASAAPLPVTTQQPAALAELTPREIVAKLVALKAAPPNQPRTLREAIYWLEELALAGQPALPAIREFLARNEDFELAVPQNRSVRPVMDSVLPLSLRFGLFEVVKRIGGKDAEAILAETSNATGRGIELVWLARALEEVTPNAYRESALASARELLGRPAASNPPSVLDRFDRDFLFEVLTLFGDGSYVSMAQEQVLNANGKVDRSALKYLQQSIGVQTIPLVVQWYDDPRIREPAQKEPLARVALSYVGADAQANELYQKAINDMTLTGSHRKNLIEDLNEDGFPDKRNITASDLPLIENRIELIEKLLPQATDAVNNAAFKEAHKDLMMMRERANKPPGSK